MSDGFNDPYHDRRPAERQPARAGRAIEDLHKLRRLLPPQRPDGKGHARGPARNARGNPLDSGLPHLADQVIGRKAVLPAP